MTDATFADDSKFLYWDQSKSAFMVSVKQKGKWEHHILKTKKICYDDLEKEAELITQRYKDQNIQWVPSTPLVAGGILPHMYTLSLGSDGKIASIYVY